MSSTIVRQALEVVDRDDREERKELGKNKTIKKLFKNSHTKGLPITKKTTISELRKNYTSKEEIYKRNLEKLKILREVTTLKLKDEERNKIIERAVTKRPVRSKPKKKTSKETVFTEEDFKKFEEEYTGE